MCERPGDYARSLRALRDPVLRERLSKAALEATRAWRRDAERWLEQRIS